MSKPLTRKEIEELCKSYGYAEKEGIKLPEDDQRVYDLAKALLSAWDALGKLRERGFLECIVDPACGNCTVCNSRKVLPQQGGEG